MLLTGSMVHPRWIASSAKTGHWQAVEKRHERSQDEVKTVEKVQSETVFNEVLASTIVMQQTAR